MSSLTTERRLIFGLLMLGSLTISFNFSAVAASIPSISASLGLSAFSVSKIVPFYMIPYGLGALLYAHLTRVFFYRYIFIVSYLVYALMNLASAFSHDLTVLLMAQAGAGIAAACSTPLSLMIIGDLFHRKIRGRLIGGYFGASFLASILGMVCMGILSWHWLFLIPGIFSFITVLLFVFFKTDLLNRRHDEEVNYLKVFSHKEIRNIFAFIFAMSFLYHGLTKWYGVFLNQQYAMDNKAVSLFLILSSSFGLLGQQVGGYFTDKRGRIFSSRLGLIILSLGAIALGLCFPKWIVPVILGSISIGWTISHNSISTVLTDFPDADRPMIASLNSSVRFISGGLGFSVAKFFVEKSFSTTFLIIGVIFLLINIVINRVLPKNV